jgi:hypothetical protein
MKNKDKRRECVEMFDWNVVVKVMTHLDWKWYDVGTPTVLQLKIRATELLDIAHYGAKRDQRMYTTSTGGIVARAFYKKGRVVGYSLSFEVAGWEEFDE